MRFPTPTEAPYTVPALRAAIHNANPPLREKDRLLLYALALIAEKLDDLRS